MLGVATAFCFQTVGGIVTRKNFYFEEQEEEEDDVRNHLLIG